MSDKQIMIGLLEKAISENRPISFQEFNEIGWDENCFLYYVELCENVRAALIVAEAIKPTKLDPQPQKSNKASKTPVTVGRIQSHKELLIQNALNQLFDWLSKMLECDEPIVAQFNLHNILLLRQSHRYAGYGIKLWHSNTPDVSPYHVYCTPEDFRYELEQWIYNIFRENKVEVVKPCKISCPLSVAQHRLTAVQNELNRLEQNEPTYTPDFNSYHSLADWAKAKSAYITQCDALNDAIFELEDYIDAVEDGSSFIVAAHTLYIHRGIIQCQRNKHQIECVNGVVYNAKGQQVTLNINHCKQCNYFFLSIDEYMYYKDLYGPFLCHLKTHPGESPHFGNMLFNEESPLQLCGYNVGIKDDLSMDERHTLLRNIINEHIVDKPTVIRYLNTFIKLNSSKSHMAIPISKWEEDLEFVRALNQPQQDLYYLSDIRSYTARL